jgi:predicted adenine nucleotide alpha hydrolase (AANH) superfamily ATPase
MLQCYSHFFLQKLQNDFPDEKLIGFFYDPNIHPYSEYQLRLLDVKRSCQKLSIELIEGEYDYQSWLNSVKGLENEREKGKRCEVCFDKRFEMSAKKAQEIGDDSFTSTQRVRPLKAHEHLPKSGEIFYKKYGVKFIALDYRSGGGTQVQSQVTKEQQLYRQDYCGCIYGLTMQREQQNKIMDEMFSPISEQTLPASIDERLKLYNYRIELEEKNINYKIIKEKFLNYRQFSFKLMQNKTDVIPAYALTYSIMPRKKAQGRIEFTHNNMHYFNREEIKFITLKYFNSICQREYKDIKELIFNPPTIEKELKFRESMTSDSYNLSPIIVVEKIPHTKLIVELDAKTYEDTKEKLIIL